MQHSTNYADTFIAVAPDSRATAAVVPPARATPSVAELTYRAIAAAPYELTSDGVLVAVHAEREGIAEADRSAAREAFFAAPRACLRSSPLPKAYGWGVHADASGRVALVAIGTPEYERLAAGVDPGSDAPVTVLAAMRSRR